MSHSRAFIALISSVLISAALLAVAVSSGAAAFSGRMGALRGEYKKISLSLAESCGNAALLRLAQEYSYQPPVAGEAVPVGESSCRILSVSTGSESASGKTVSIVSSGAYRSAYTLLRTEAAIPAPSVSSAPIQLGAYEEVSTP